MASFEDIPKAKSKPKGKANGFLKFMLDFKRRSEREGDFLSMEEAQVAAGEKWKDMGPEERSKYVESAAESSFNQVKYTSTGVSFEEMDRRKQEARQQQRMMELTIEEMLQVAVEKNELMSLEFVFISTSYFVKSLSGEIFPAELAMSKFSLRDGVNESFSMLINPGPLPMGMAANAKDHAAATHRIPSPPKDNVKSEDDFGYIYNTVMRFLVGADGTRKIPPIFVETGSKSDEIQAAIKTLDKIVELGGAARNFSFRVYPIEQLLFRLHKKCVARRTEIHGTAENMFTSVPMAKAIFEQNPFHYYDIGCEFHRDQDNSVNCCLAKVKRWGYRFAQLCLDAERDILVHGKHLPEKVAVGDSDLLSQESKNSMWDTKLSESFRAISIDSNTTQKSLSTDSDAPETNSIGSIELTRGIVASSVDATESVKTNKYKGMSYSQLLRLGGRGGKTSSSISSRSSQK